MFVVFLVEPLFQLAPYRDLRYAEIVRQTDWYTCGPAAVATLLTYYYNIPTTEAEALELAEGFMRAQGLEPAKGINALALKQTLEAKGILTKGFRVKPEALKDYFDRGGLPLIAHLTEPQKHFVVVWDLWAIKLSSVIRLGAGELFRLLLLLKSTDIVKSSLSLSLWILRSFVL